MQFVNEFTIGKCFLTLLLRMIWVFLVQMIFWGLDIKDRNKVKTNAFSEIIVYNFFELKFEYTVNVYILLGCTKVNLRAIKKIVVPLENK